MRQPGYYWCKYKGEWEVAEFTSFHNQNHGSQFGWFITAYAGVYKDSDFQEIDERRIERQPIVDNAKHDIKPPTEEELSAMIHNPQPPHTNQFY